MDSQSPLDGRACAFGCAHDLSSVVEGCGLPSDPTLPLSDDDEDMYSDISIWWTRYHVAFSEGVVFKSNAGGSDEFGHVSIG